MRTRSVAGGAPLASKGVARAAGLAYSNGARWPASALAAWTARRWLHRFEAEGCAGLAEMPRSGRPPVLTTANELFLRQAVARSPRDYGYARPGWTTALLARLVRRQFKRSVTAECVRQHLAQVDGVCRRPTWTVRCRAQAEPGYAQKKAGLPDV